MTWVKAAFVLVVIAIVFQATEGRLCFKQLCQSNSNNVLRGCDTSGCGNYNARRGWRKHKGVDIKCSEGDTVYAPFPAKYARLSRPYGPSHKHFNKAFNTGLVINGRNEWKDFRAKIFYVSRKAGTRTYSAGSVMGTYQKLGYAGITQHVHVQLYKKIGRRYSIVNPTGFLC